MLTSDPFRDGYSAEGRRAFILSASGEVKVSDDAEEGDRDGDSAEAAHAPGKRAHLAPIAALAVVLVAPALLLFAWSRPAAAPPTEMPPLVLEPSAIEAQLAADRDAAARAPSGEAALERLRLYHETNVAEQEAREPPGRAQARHEELVRALAAVATTDEERAAVRASDVARLEPALHGELPAGERAAELGGFVGMMQRYGLARGDRQIAPRFVVRTLFKGRWNALHDRELTEGFSPIELVAYHGWLALRAEGAPSELRLQALDHYAEAGGGRALEARAVLLYDEGRLEEAREAFEDAAAATSSFRLRNHALACAAE